ncbi:DUF4399 domain-containing protein [Hydrogenophaga sp. XSHU_21]
MRFLPLTTAALAGTLLAGCAGHRMHGMEGMQGMHHMHHGGGGTAAPATAPAKVGASTPTLTSGYKKVAAAPNARLYFVNLTNGATVSNPVKVVFGLSGMGVAPAGIEKEGTGHHHLLVNVAEWDPNGPLPANDNFRHFGAGQTETSVTLPPGTHTLQLVLGDQNHIPHHPVVASERITVTVK